MSSVVTTLTMSDLIDECLDILHQAHERPRQVQLTAAAADNDTTVTVDSVAADNIAPTDVLEFGRELMLVTAISAQTVTVSRGYNATTAVAHTINTLGNVNPRYPRYVLDRDIRRCFKNVLVTKLPFICSETLFSGNGSALQTMRPVDQLMMEAYDLRYMDSSGRVSKVLGSWGVEDWLPAEAGYTGKSIRVPRGYWDKDLILTYSKAYSWSGSGETATIDVPLAAEELPVLYAIAKQRTGLEISKEEFDQIEEWPQQVQRSQSRSANLRLIQALWGQFFQQLDTAIGAQNVPMRRVYRRHPHRLGSTHAHR